MKDWRVTPVDGVDVTYEWRGWRIWCQWPTRSRRDIETQLRVEYHGPGAETPLVRSTRRLTLTSSSGLSSLVTDMRRLKIDVDDLDRLVNHVAEDLIYWYRQSQTTVYPKAAQRDGAGWLIYPVWPKAGITAVAAAGGSYKSFIAQGLALQLATGTEILSGNTRRPHQPVRTLFLDWEADADTFSERLFALNRGADLDDEPVLAYKQMRIPLVDAVDGLCDEIRVGRFGAVVIDSMSASIGGDLIDASIVNGFFDACRLLDVPCLVLAHKSAEAVQKRSQRFFGSVMSENRVRLAWNAEKAVDSRSVLWTVFKDNNMGRWGDRLAWRVDIGHDGEDPEHRRLASIQFRGVNPDNVALAADEGNKAIDQISYALAGAAGGLMRGEIEQLVDLKSGTVGTTLKRAVDEGKLERAGDGRYRLSTRPDPL